MALVTNQFSQSSVQGQLTLITNENVFPCKVSKDSVAALVPGSPVKLVDEASKEIIVDLATDGDTIFGFVAYDTKQSSYVAGDRLQVAGDGCVMYMTAGAALARGAKVSYNHTTGKLAALGSADSIGTLLDKAAINDLVRVKIKFEDLATST